VDYAVSDAYVALLVYQTPEKIQRLGNVSDDAPPDLQVSIYQHNSQKIIALGTWSSHNSNPDAVVNGIRITPLNAAVEIYKITVPGAVMTEYNCLLSSFGPPPFTVVCKRSQICSSSIELESDAGNSDSIHPQLDTRSISAGIASDVNDEVVEYTGNNSWLTDVDDEQTENVAQVESPNSTTADQESFQHGKNIFLEMNKEKKNSPPIHSHVLKDVWHAFDMIVIPKNHGLRRIFARALCDAIFIVNPEDKAFVDA
jgi:hypothetical protein